MSFLFVLRSTNPDGDLLRVLSTSSCRGTAAHEISERRNLPRRRLQPLPKLGTRELSFAGPHKLRPQDRAPASFLTANLPPTLAKSQVSSVRKNLKLHLLSVLKHPASLEFQAQITTLLVDLGTPQAEIARNMPSGKDARKRPRDDSDSTLKKMKLGELRS